jgi:hypothetical protein
MLPTDLFEVAIAICE